MAVDFGLAGDGGAGVGGEEGGFVGGGGAAEAVLEDAGGVAGVEVEVGKGTRMGEEAAEEASAGNVGEVVGLVAGALAVEFFLGAGEIAEVIGEVGFGGEVGGFALGLETGVEGEAADLGVEVAVVVLVGAGLFGAPGGVHGLEVGTLGVETELLGAAVDAGAVDGLVLGFFLGIGEGLEGEFVEEVAFGAAFGEEQEIQVGADVAFAVAEGGALADGGGGQSEGDGGGERDGGGGGAGEFAGDETQDGREGLGGELVRRVGGRRAG